jgi:hypothetical protein
MLYIYGASSIRAKTAAAIESFTAVRVELGPEDRAGIEVVHPWFILGVSLLGAWFRALSRGVQVDAEYYSDNYSP